MTSETKIRKEAPDMIEIIPFKAEHLAQVYEIEVDSFSIPWSRRDLEKDALENHISVYFVAVDGDKVVGYGGMWHVVTEGHITNVAVRESYRNQGVGSQLITALLAAAFEREMIGVTLEVRMNNMPAQKLYTKHGFKVEGIRKNYYADTKEDALIMWRYFEEFQE